MLAGGPSRWDGRGGPRRGAGPAPRGRHRWRSPRCTAGAAAPTCRSWCPAGASQPAPEKRPYAGDLPDFEFEDATGDWRAGWADDPEGPNSVTLRDASWDNNRVVVGGFGSASGGTRTVLPGDRLDLTVWTPARTASATWKGALGGPYGGSTLIRPAAGTPEPAPPGPRRRRPGLRPVQRAGRPRGDPLDHGLLDHAAGPGLLLAQAHRDQRRDHARRAATPSGPIANRSVPASW